MKVEQKDTGEITLFPEGVFDHETGMKCVELISEKVTQPTAVYINLSLSDYIDSSGIGALNILMDELPEGSPMLTLIKPSEEVRMVLEMCCMNQLLNIVSE